jgi:alkaline phosphatase D
MQGGPVKFPAFHDAFDSWQKVADLNPDFVLFIGDFIYVDHPHYIDQTPEAYAIRYRQSFSEQSYQNNARKLPSMFMYDDHEIVDNWDAYDDLATGGKSICFETSRCFNSTTMYVSAMEMYRKYLGNTNPPTKWNTTSQQNPDVELFYDYTYGDNAFFVADNRGFRSINTVVMSSPTKNFLGPAQLAAVFSWLLANNATAVFKFLMIPASFTNFINPAKLDWKTGGGDDGYSVFPVEREKLISFIQTNNIRNVFILTGDVHVPFAIKIRENLYEFSSSPMGGFAAQDNAFESASPVKLDHPDAAYQWSDEEYVSYWGNAASYISLVTVNSTARPATLKIEYFKNPNLAVPLYARHFTEI